MQIYNEKEHAEQAKTQMYSLRGKEPPGGIIKLSVVLKEIKCL